MMLNTERLTLREVSIDDIQLVYQLLSLPEVDKYNTLGVLEDIEQVKTKIEKWIDIRQSQKGFTFLIKDVQQNFVGLIGIHFGKEGYKSAEVWYKLLPLHWNKGYASEAVNCILNFCFEELKLHRVCAGSATENTTSIKVLEKTGFTREGHCRKILPIRGEWIDNYEYAILEEDYFKNKIQ